MWRAGRGMSVMPGCPGRLGPGCAEGDYSPSGERGRRLLAAHGHQQLLVADGKCASDLVIALAGTAQRHRPGFSRPRPLTRPLPGDVPLHGECGSWRWRGVLAALLSSHGVGDQLVFDLPALVADEQVDQLVTPPGGLKAGRGRIVANHD